MNVLYVTVSAVEQLQVMASKRQYKEAAAQVEVRMVAKTLVSNQKEKVLVLKHHFVSRFLYVSGTKSVIIKIQSNKQQTSHVFRNMLPYTISKRRNM